MAPLLLRPPAPPRPRYLQPEPTKNARAEMLTALNKGEGVTAGLRKVTARPIRRHGSEGG